MSGCLNENLSQPTCKWISEGFHERVRNYQASECLTSLQTMRAREKQGDDE